MVSSNLKDIEVIFNKQPNIRHKMMVDTNEETTILASRITEVCDIFPKLTGLNSLTATNIRKKTENGFVELKKTGLIGEAIQPKDVIYFDLHFYEIWLDIEMALECGNRSYVIKFDLKVKINSIKSEFENTLINLGIQSWAKIVSEDYYAFTELVVDYPPQMLNHTSSMNIIQKLSNNTISNNINGSIDADNIVTFDFDSKLTCKLIFTNISEVIFEHVSLNDRLKSSSFSSTVNETQRNSGIKNHFNDYFAVWLLGKIDIIAVYEHILWRIQSQFDNIIIDDNNSSFISEDSANISLSSIVLHSINNDDRPDSTGNFTKITKKPSFDPKYKLRGNSFQNSKMNLEKQFLFSKKNKKESSNFKTSIDYNLFINKYAALYVPLKDFDNNSPDTKNLVELCNGIIENFEIEVNHNYYKDDIWKISKRNRLKKWVWIIGIIVVIFLIYISLN